MAREIPKYYETFIPILKVLSDGTVLDTGELFRRVRDEFYGDLPKDLLEQRTKSGHILIINRIGWGKAYLKQAEMIAQPAFSKVQITSKGLKILSLGQLSLQELLKDKDFLANRKEQRTGEEVESHQESTPQDLIDSGIRAIEAQVKSDLLTKLKTVNPYYFQTVVLQLLEKMGYGSLTPTPKSGDGGIDGIINQDKLGLEKIYIQAKRYADSKVREVEVRNFIGAMSRDTNKGIFATTSTFDDKAIQKAHDASQKIIMIDGPMLADLLYTHGVGVQVRDTYEVKQLDDDFFEEDSV